MSEIDNESELAKKIAELESDKAKLVSEIQAERAKKQAAEEAKRLAEEELKKKEVPAPTVDDSDPEKIVVRVLEKKEQEAAKTALEEAKADLKRMYNEFSQDTDAGGILFSKFENELSKFNLSGLRTKEQFLNRFKEVYEFMNRTKKSVDTKPNFHPGTPQFGSDAPAIDGATLSDAEMKVIQEQGITKERYLKIKEKHPNFVQSLLKNR